MRKIQGRDDLAPSVLAGPEAKDARAKIAEHYRQPEEQRLQRRIPLDRKLLYSVEVVRALATLSHGKCSYCETPIEGTTGTVDHFRPLTGTLGIGTHGAEDSPDYYGWFAYEWRNFFIACRACNSAKSNKFPVSGRRAPLLCAWQEANDAEEGTILDPCRDTPEKHLRISVAGQMTGHTVRGERTISCLDLNREKLLENRAWKIQRCLDLLRRAIDGTGDAEYALEAEIADEKAFSGVARIFLVQLIDEVARRLGMPKSRSSNLVNTAIRLLKLLPTQLDIAEFAVKAEADVTSRAVAPYDDHDVFYEVGEGIARLGSVSSISRIEIRNFKGIGHLAFDLTDQTNRPDRARCMMLLGENSTGKSSVLQAVALCLMGDDMRRRLKLDAEDYLSRDVTGWKFYGDRDCFIQVTFDNQRSVQLVIDAARKRFEGSGGPATILLAFGSRRFFDTRRKRGQATDRVKTLFDPLCALPDLINWLNGIQEREFYAVARAVRGIFVLDEKDDLFRSDDGEILVRAHGRATPINNLSEGYRSLFAMTISAMKHILENWDNFESARGVVLIDEIETHLHPRWKVRVMAALRDAFPLVQFIATTHDPLCLRGMDAGEVEVLYRNEEFEVERMVDLPDVKSLRTDQLLTSDYFGLLSAADPDYEQALDEYASLKGEQLGADANSTKLLELEAQIEKTLKIGDTPFQQIVHEASSRYVEHYKGKPMARREQFREASVKDVLDALIKARGE